jgi:hypothetical protein
MRRPDLIRTLVLNEVGDDYENLHHIKREVVKVGLSAEIEIQAAEIGAALVDLITIGIVKAYQLYPSPVREVANAIALASLPVDLLAAAEKPGDLHYLQTPRGREIHQGAEWPFDDEGRLLCAIEEGA